MQFEGRPRQPFFYSPISAEKLFGGLSSHSRNYLESLSEHSSFAADRVVFSAGDPPVHIFILNSGMAEASSPVFAFGAGQVFGITEALSGNNFETSLRTITICDFDVIKRSDFLALLHEDSDVCFRLATAVSELNHKAVFCMRGQEK